jgi:hypothetical protein
MSKWEKTPRQTHRFLWLAAILVTLIIVQILFDAYSVLGAFAGQVVIRIQLAQARQRWQAAGIDDYDLTVSGYSPLTCIIMQETVHVRDGQAEAPRAAYWEFCQVARSVPQAFEIVEEKLGWGGDLLQVRFDRQYGYVAEFSYNCNDSHGLLSGVASDCSGGFHIDSFMPVGSP